MYLKFILRNQDKTLQGEISCDLKDKFKSKREKRKFCGTLQEIYGEMNPIYKKFDNSMLNTVPLDRKQYFASVFYDFKKIK